MEPLIESSSDEEHDPDLLGNDDSRNIKAKKRKPNNSAPARSPDGLMDLEDMGTYFNKSEANDEV